MRGRKVTYEAETIGALEVEAGAGSTRIAFADERRRTELGADVAASVTLSGGEESWGEFLNFEDVVMVRQWCDRLLEQELARRLT